MSSSTDPLPPGMNSIAVINPCLQSVIIGQTFITLLIPLLIALFYYSTPFSRRQPLFILNVFALTVAFTACSILHVMSIHMLLSPQNMWPAQVPLIISIGFLGIFQSVLADTILLVRLMIIHPLNHVGPARFTLLISFPIILKVVRGVNLILFIMEMAAVANSPNAFQEILSNAWLAGPYMKLEWVTQVVDNTYASVAFLWTIWSFRADNPASASFICAATLRQSSFAQRIRILFNLALSNFLIPTVMSIIQLAVLCKFGETNWVLLNDVSYVNAMVSVFGVVFATVWAKKEQQRGVDVSRDSLPAERGTHGAGEWRVRSVVGTMSTEKYQSDITSSGTSDQPPGSKLPV